MATIGTEWTKLVEYTSTDTYSITYRLYAKITATNIGSNANTVQMKWTTQKTSGGTGVYDNDSTTPTVTYVSSGTTTATWTGTAFTIAKGSAVTETDRTTSGSITITHDSNGSYTKTWNWSLSHVYEGGSKSGSVSVTLPTIPRASTFSLSSTSITTIGTTTATITRADSSFAHKITTVYSGTTYYLLGSASATSTSTSASLSIPAGLRNAMRTNKATSVTLTLTLTTYSGSTSIGTSTTQLTVSVPTATITVSPSSVACNSATTTWTLSNVDTEACVYTVQRLYGSTVRYTDLTRGTTTTKSSLANANFQANITTATSGTVTAKVTTYVGTSSSYTQVGTSTATYTVTIPTGTYKPSVANTSITRTGTAYGSVAYLSGYNGATIVFTTSITGNSAITSREVSVTPASVQYTTSISGNTVTVNVGTLPSSASNYTVNVVCTATDGRGTSASATRTFTATGYSKPTIKATIQRADASGNADAVGQYANISATATAPQSSFKMANVTIRYNSTSGTVVKSQDGTTQSLTASVTKYGGSYNINTEYTFYVIATDSLGLQSTYKLTLPTASVVFSRHKNGGIGFGRIAQADEINSAYPILRVNSTSAQNQIISGSSTSDKNNSVSAWALSGRIYLVARGTATDDKALVSMNHAGTTNDIIRVNQDNNISEIRPIISNLTHRNHYIIPNVYLDGATAGYYVICTITVTETYCDMPFDFKIIKRGNQISNVMLRLSSTNSGATHNVNVFEADFHPNTFYVNKSADNTFQIICTKPAYSSVCLADFQTGSYNTDRCTIDFTTSFLSALPDGAVQATRTKFIASWADGATTADSANKASNVTVTDTQPTAATGYYINFGTATGGNLPMRANAGFIHRMKQGTTSAEGYNGLVLGRNVAKGSANNGYGFIRLFGHGTNYYSIYPNDTTNTSDITFYLSNIGGTLAIRDATVTGTLKNGSWVTVEYPTGYTKANCHVTGWDVDYNGNYRTGDGLENSATTSRVLISLESDGIKVYTGSSTYNGKTIRVFLSLNA